MKKSKIFVLLIMIISVFVVGIGTNPVYAVTYKYTAKYKSVTMQNNTVCSVKISGNYGIGETKASVGKLGTKSVYVQARHKDSYGNYYYSDEKYSVVVANNTTATAKTKILNTAQLNRVAAVHQTNIGDGLQTAYTSTK